MKRFFVVFLCALALSAKATPQYTEGVEYELISPPAPTQVPAAKVEVVEVFWYGCPHCYAFEPYLEGWLESKPKAAKFVRVPATVNPSWLTHARAYYALEAIGEANAVHEAFFQAIHEQGRLLTDVDSIARFLTQLGVDAQAFKEVYSSPQVTAKVEQADELMIQYAITGVPSVIVDGRYRTSASQAGSYEEMLKIVNYLVALEAS
jgi:protein dithiol oxidoreductase (disulfide-forming)